MKKELILIGGGGHCTACIDVIEQEGRFAIAGIVDVAEKVGQVMLGYPIINTDNNFTELIRNFEYFLITIGQIRFNKRRVEIFEELKDLGAKLPRVISPNAYVSPHAKIGEGTIVMHGAVVNACASVGSNCIINSQALVEHDATVGSHCHISTGAIVNGGTVVKAHTFIGSQTMLREGIEIGEYSIIGAGMSVFKSLPPRSSMRKS